MIMNAISRNSIEKGGATACLFSCLFDKFESVTHFTHSHPQELLNRLQNIYAVCVAINTSKTKKIISGFVVKTSYTHNDNDFLGALENILELYPNLAGNEKASNISFLPAKIGVIDDQLLSEHEMIQLLVQQRLKHTQIKGLGA